MATWTGPCKAVIASYSDPLAMKLARIAGKQQVSFKYAYDGRSAEVFRIERDRGKYLIAPLGKALGGDPIHTAVSVVLNYCEFTDEAFSTILVDIERRHDDILHELEQLVRRTDKALDDLGAAHRGLRV